MLGVHGGNKDCRVVTFYAASYGQGSAVYADARSFTNGDSKMQDNWEQNYCIK